MAALALSIAASPPAHTADDVDALIARPASPGTLAMLVAHVRDPRVAAHWRASLAHESPQVRATAARMLFVNGIKPALPDLAKVLAQDSDPAVALEAARALLVMGDATADEAVLGAAGRLDDSRLTLAFVDTRGPAALPSLERIAGMKLEKDQRIRVISALTAGDAQHLDRAADFVLTSGDLAFWLALLNVAHDQRVALAPARVRAGLESPSAAIRAYTWWHVAVLAAYEELPDGLTVDPSSSADLPEIPSNLAFGRELAARTLARAKPEADFPVTPPQVGEALPMPAFGVGALSGTLHSFMTKKEREVLRVGKDPLPSHRVRQKTVAGDYPAIRTVSDYPDGYVADVLRQTGCQPKEPALLAGAIVKYTTRKHLQELQWTASELKSPCSEASRYLLAAALLPAPLSVKPDQQHMVVVPMGPTFLQCLAGSYKSRAPVQRVGQSGIVPPKKVRDVRPEYPAMALNNRRQGTVIIEATISPAGCVDRAEVVRGAATDFDVEALRAVSGWGFTPTLLNGQPVPVVMTVTVQFAVQ